MAKKLRILVNTRPITNLLNHFFKHPKPILILKFLSIQIKCNTRPMLILNKFIKNCFFGIFHNSLFFNEFFSERPYDLLINDGHGRIVLNKDNRDLKCFPDCPQSSYCDMGMCRCKHRLLVRLLYFFQ